MRPALVLLALLTAAPAAQAEPYADSDRRQRQIEYLQDREDFLRLVKNLYLAVGCKIVSSEGQILPMLSEQRRVRFSGPPVSDPQFEPLIKEAARAGLALAAEARGCDFYSTDPNAARYVRKAAEEAYVRAIR